jgi:hypothetical protein
MNATIVARRLVPFRFRVIVLNSTLFWIKMGLFILLMVNGLLLVRAERAAARDDVRGWSRLTTTSMMSIALWFLITLLGAA